jgi:hypothetical protein
VCVCLLAYSVDSRNEKLYCDVTFESGAGCNQHPRRATVYWQHSVGFILFYFLPVDKSKSNSRPRPTGRRETPCDKIVWFSSSTLPPPPVSNRFIPQTLISQPREMETFDFIFDFDFDFVTDRGRLHHQRASVRIIFPEVPHENDQLRANGICHVSKRTTAAAAGPLSRRLLIPHTAGQKMSASRDYGGSSHGYCIIKCVSNSSWPDRNISGRSLGPTHTHRWWAPGNGRRTTTTTQDDLTVAAAFSLHFYFI